jgi:hypothetical protein
MREVAEISEDEMIATFLRGELTSERFGDDVRAALASSGLDERVLVDVDLTDEEENGARRRLLAATGATAKDAISSTRTSRPTCTGSRRP